MSGEAPLAPFPALEDAENLLARYEEEPSHVRQVAHLADRLFGALAGWHRRGTEDRQRLRLAALLHDIGWSRTPTGRGHHKESARLIGAYRWKHLPPRDVALVAQTARYHRKKLPAAGHSAYQALPREDRATVDLLAGFLRIADALDRTHTSRIATLGARVDEKRIVVEVVPEKTAEWSAERAAFLSKNDLLERVSGRIVSVMENA